jgi:multidrug resistance efflux pump
LRTKPTVIPTPWMRLIRIKVQRLLPAVTWWAAVAVLVVLGQRQMVRSHILPGVVETRLVTVSPLADGVLGGVSVDLFDTVKGGHVLAVMDDALVRGELLTAEAELRQLQAQVEAEQVKMGILQSREENDAGRLKLDLEQGRLDLLDRVTKLESNKAALTRLEMVVQREKELLQSGLIDDVTYEKDRLEYESLKASIAEGEKALEEAKRQKKEADSQQSGSKAEREASVLLDAVLKPISESISVQETLINQIVERQKTLVLRAPVDGKVAQILQRPGDTVMAGIPILSLDTGEGRRVLGYVEENTRIVAKEGDVVEVFLTTNPQQVVTAKVLKTGPLVEEFPVHLRRNPTLAQWGRAILVGELPADPFLPGQAVSVRLISNS